MCVDCRMLRHLRMSPLLSLRIACTPSSVAFTLAPPPTCGWRELCQTAIAQRAPLLLNHKAQALLLELILKRRKAEASAARLQRRDDLAHIVADQAEARVL